MIIINNLGYLKYKNLKFRCSLGKAGVGVKKREGDNITPKGTFKIIKIYYRKDKIKKIRTIFKLIKIEKNMGWCNDPRSKRYNKEIKIPFNFSYEKLYRRDSLYDLILVLDYNHNPIIKNKGSAIFIHLASEKYKSTAGCIGLKKNNLINLISKIKLKEKIMIK